MKTSFAQSIWPIHNCLVEAETILGENRDWRNTNVTQENFLRYYLPSYKGVFVDVVRSIASFSAQEIEEWLKQNGFEMKLNPLKDNSFGVASVLDVLLKWQQNCAEKSELHVDDTRYNGVWIKSGAKFLYTSAHNAPKKPIVKLPTDDEHTSVFMTMVSEPPEGVFGLIDYAKYLSSTKKQRLDLYDDVGVIFPMIHLEEHTELDWIQKMWTKAQAGEIAWIEEALQVNRLRMNEEGVRAQSAVRMEFATLGCPSRRPYIFNRPFLLWIERDGISEPLFVAWLNFDSWKDPLGLK